jgi:hypothetical protein
MAQQGSDDAKLHAKHAAQINWLQRNMENTMAVVQKHDESIEELKRDVKVAKSSWMKEKAQ